MSPHRLRCLVAACLLALTSGAEALPFGPWGSAPDPVPRASPRLAQGGCSSAAREAAAQTGGQVLSVQVSNQGGRTVCVVTVLIPAQGGDRPRRQTITIEQ